MKSNDNARLKNLILCGEKLDSFLSVKNNYYKLDYLVSPMYRDNNYNNYHFFKIYSICEMLLKSSKKYIDKDLALYLNDSYTNSE